MSTLSTLPPRYRQSGGGGGGVVGGRAAGGGAGDVVGGRAAGGGSRLLQIQAKLQARQLQEKEEKLFNLLEDRKEPVLPRLGRENVYSGNSLTSSSSSVSMFAGRPVLGGGQVRQIFQERSKTSNTRNSRRSPVGWDKSYPLRPVEVEPRTPHVPVYKQNITRTNSYNKYSGNYGVNKSNSVRGVSLDRSVNQNKYSKYNMVRTQSQNCIGSSSEESFTSSRPHSGIGFSKSRSNQYILSPDESPVTSRREIKTTTRDYTRPLPPTYRKYRGSSPMTQSYHDSAYSSHSSDRSDGPVTVRKSESVQSSPSKTYERKNSFSFENLNYRTYKKQKSPVRKEYRSPSLSPTRSDEEGSDSDIYSSRSRAKTVEREREEERRRMQFEMRKREQELLAKIKEQQRELDEVKLEKNKVEKALTLRAHDEARQRALEDARQIALEESHRKALEESRKKAIEDSQQERIGRRQNSCSRDPRSGSTRGTPDRTPPSERVQPERLLNRERSQPSSFRRPRKIEVEDRPSTNSRPPLQPRPPSQPRPPVHSETVKRDRPGLIRKSPSSSDINKEMPQRRSVFAPKPRDDLSQCKNCGRNFAEDRIEKHETICTKTTQKKRKPFDMTKKRVQGTDAAPYVKKQGTQKPSNNSKDQKKSDWRKKREEFIATLRSAKAAQKHLAAGGSLKDLPPPPPMDTSDYIKCPHCDRRFSEAAADRHIPKCKDIKSNKKR